MKRKDLTGHCFGLLRVLGPAAPHKHANGDYLWLACCIKCKQVRKSYGVNLKRNHHICP